MVRVVYYSSPSDNTHRFIEKLGLPATRIPIHYPRVDRGEADFLVEEDYVLVVPTYGGGNARGAVPKQVIKFLNNPANRAHIRGVIAAGNTNFGEAYCIAGDIISQKCQVPFLYQFELLGTANDVERVREGLEEFWQQHSLTPA